ncbi:MAG: tRNA uridine-5-carboxymethylaminomethyl(34) synthesis GTPase MnmE [Janthinobacterium lividum]
MTDTIMALASGSGRAAVSVLRLSGPGCGAVLDRLCGRPAPRRASLRALREAGEVLDRALVLWMPGPGSYTGEDCAELQLHGGVAVVAAVTGALARLGVRPAEAGEFTRRAVLAGRMGVLEAEGVADLVASEDEAQRRQALRQMEGGLGRRLAGWAERLRVVLAQQEALIDFPDEDLPPEVEAVLLAEVAALAGEMRRGLADAAAGERVRDGLVVAVAGAPDVGKSSLVNALAEREVAIVASGAGTTRDVLEVALDVGGVRVALLDTAGLRETADPVEAEGVRRARARAAAADLVILVRDAASAGTEPGTEAGGEAGPHGAGAPRVLVVLNKAELGGGGGAAGAGLRVSARTGLGMAALRARLGEEVARLVATGGVPLTRARHRAALGEAVAALERAEAVAWPELRGEELRLALRAVGRITGEVDVDALLDTVFSRFCIGK